MFSRDGLDSNAIGKYSEMAVIAAFIARGAEVALPFGNQSKWDLLVKRRGESAWKSVQVKTIQGICDGQNPVVSIHHQGKKRASFKAGEIDILIAVHPESGTMWSIPPDKFVGRNRIPLLDSYLWIGVVIRPEINIVRKTRPVSLEIVRARQAASRAPLRLRLPHEKPVDMTIETWQTVLQWCDGKGYKTIARSVGVRPSAVRERILRALHRMGLRDLPSSILKGRIYHAGHLKRMRKERVQVIRTTNAQLNLWIA